MERDEAERLLDSVCAILDLLDEAGFLSPKRDRCEPDDPARFDVPDINPLMFALLEAGGKHRPVSAKEVALVIWDGEHGHGDVVKLGLRLGMMASVGLVERHLVWFGSRKANRWTLPKTPALA
jgi:hypothetical protein